MTNVPLQNIPVHHFYETTIDSIAYAKRAIDEVRENERKGLSARAKTLLRDASLELDCSLRREKAKENNT